MFRVFIGGNVLSNFRGQLLPGKIANLTFDDQHQFLTQFFIGFPPAIKSIWNTQIMKNLCNVLIRLIQQQPRVFRMDGQDKLRVIMELPGATERVRAAQDVLVSLGAPRPS